MPTASVYDEAMKITEQEFADEFLRRLVDIRGGEEPCISLADALKGELENLGWYAGYFNHEVRDRVERLFGCSHPVFGTIAENGPPTTEEALELGKLYGQGKKVTLSEYRQGGMTNGDSRADQEDSGTGVRG